MILGWTIRLAHADAAPVRPKLPRRFCTDTSPSPLVPPDKEKGVGVAYANEPGYEAGQGFLGKMALARWRRPRGEVDWQYAVLSDSAGVAEFDRGAHCSLTGGRRGTIVPSAEP